MSTTSHRSRSRSSARSGGLPTWSGIAIVIAALITGLLLSINTQSVGVPYLLCFALAAVVVASLTEVRGLFLTVASIPLIFGVLTVITSWVVNRSQASEGTPALSTTAIATALFPLAQFFPVLVGVFALATAIAAVRVWLSRRSGRVAEKEAIAHRRRTAEADRRNRDAASRARRRTNQVTVEELMARSRSRSTEPRPPRPQRPQRPLRPQQPQQRPETRQAPPAPQPPRRREAPRRRRLDDDLYG
ncbi:DUF6542 domain-containing protein [Corynebacterium sp.]|uniref:DUF6542 domain-containing protein n=1 Tax=Corynebacterium sp. TaxID=1720 RepID=UPI0026E0B635|nr:DUF6542 domain-containing protein [Corynebacterium sp.]MDO5512927.1 hypothetical protein [Corynebacterium sp.]